MENISEYYGLKCGYKGWVVIDSDIADLARSLQSSTEPIHKSEKLFYALKAKLYSIWREKEDVKAKEYYDILSAFLP